jgi:hypothetical protein
LQKPAKTYTIQQKGTCFDFNANAVLQRNKIWNIDGADKTDAHRFFDALYQH